MRWAEVYFVACIFLKVKCLQLRELISPLTLSSVGPYSQFSLGLVPLLSILTASSGSPVTILVQLLQPPIFRCPDQVRVGQAARRFVKNPNLLRSRTCENLCVLSIVCRMQSSLFCRLAMPFSFMLHTYPFIQPRRSLLISPLKSHRAP